MFQDPSEEEVKSDEEAPTATPDSSDEETEETDAEPAKTE